MHGRRRQQEREPTQDELQQAKQRVDRYRTLNSHVMDLKATSVSTNDALDATKRLLEQNTELHTVWNYRRTIFTSLDEWQCQDTRQEMLDGELKFLLGIITKNIKSYWMWNHRMWALSSLPRPEWQRELGLVAKLLALDARNYHGWDYRRFVVAQLKDAATDKHEVDTQEFAFTTEQINHDCANHSAWHNRSKLLPEILAQRDEDGQLEVLQTENDLILNAIYTDPDDQNAWLYYDWLLDIQKSDEDRSRLLRNKIAAIRELLELEEDSKRPLVELVSAYAELERLQSGSVSEPEKKECLETLRRLESIDPYRVGRYTDMSRTLSKQWALSA
ncbi:Rab geranylgeranyltransferase [Coemansia sp. RSA 353]|nr:Rab geranylgeranyltransferase [Coemansia sp. RSA 562]KAJ2184197.1 Rab geranylgeranyltransferase [Coemansia sp. RSA 532]KAJ2228709.1 Rab geranylgeranyltransferase [Coemansia sp. RSA 518]KAJ2275115.1 Rab geranylgeranyltransferase [Coemansia sp. RSA 370]KAJ2287680.1 Rab geranylgeranyltransferase [Coemansia sp. RSA 355]KAJ2295592.1 Rab geranylgeranyltransferase [Coemansia sp. RSA 353]